MVTGCTAPGDGARAERISSDGFVGAVFTHRTSRAGDPQLHSHVVLANLLRGSDGRWSAVDSRAVHQHALAAGYTYQAVLRGELTVRLGLAWTAPVKGVAEVVGVPTQLRAAFSQRRAAIFAELTRTGTGGRRAAQRAAYATRPGKSRTPEPTLRERWAARARDAGIDPRALERTVLFRQQVPDRPTLEALVDEVLGPAGVTRHRTSFDRRDALAAVAVSLPTGLPVTGAQLEALTDRVLASRDAVALLGSADAGAETTPRYSSADLLAAEARALALAELESRVAPVEAAQVAALTRSRLGADQRAMVTRLMSSTGTVDVVVGPAGAGKTAALATARRLWAEAGTPVLGTALAAVAARRLGASTAMPAGSLSRLLTDADRVDPATGRPSGLAPGTVVVLDEAGLVGTRALTRLLEHVSAAGGKAVLVGDPAQLPEIEAGGLFGALAARESAPELTGNRRQRLDWEWDALAHLRAGRAGLAMADYVRHDRVHLAEPDRVVATLATDYLALRDTAASPYDVIALVSRRADVAALNEVIRDQRRHRGELTGAAVELAGPTGPLPVAVGELVLVTRNDPDRGVHNGTRPPSPP